MVESVPEHTVFRYERPDLGDRPKRVVRLARTDQATMLCQVVRRGGENNLHSHRHLDGFWFVLRGHVRFYTTDDEVVGDLGPHEGILVPRNYPYWFESVGDEDLELLQFEASDLAMATDDDVKNDRVDHTPVKAWMQAPEAS